MSTTISQLTQEIQNLSLHEQRCRTWMQIHKINTQRICQWLEKSKPALQRYILEKQSLSELVTSILPGGDGGCEDENNNNHNNNTNNAAAGVFATMADTWRSRILKEQQEIILKRLFEVTLVAYNNNDNNINDENDKNSSSSQQKVQNNNNKNNSKNQNNNTRIQTTLLNLKSKLTPQAVIRLIPLLHHWLLIVEDSICFPVAAATSSTSLNNTNNNPHHTTSSDSSSSSSSSIHQQQRYQERSMALVLLSCIVQYFSDIIKLRSLRGVMRNIVVDLYDIFEDGSDACVPLTTDEVCQLANSINDIAQL